MPYKYRTSKYSHEIKKIEIIRETHRSIFLKKYSWDDAERREPKISDYHRYFDSWNEAHTYLIIRTEKRIDAARIELDKAIIALNDIKEMKEEL